MEISKLKNIYNEVMHHRNKLREIVVHMEDQIAEFDRYTRSLDATITRLQVESELKGE